MNLALCLNGKNGKRYDGESESFVVNCLDRHMGSGGVDDNAAQANHLIAHTLRGEGHDAGEDGTGRGTPLVFQHKASVTQSMNPSEVCPSLGTTKEPAVFQCHGSNVGPMGTLRSGNGNETGGVPFVAFAQNQRDELREMPVAGALANQPGMKQQTYVAFQTRIARNGRGQPKDITDALTSCDGGTHADSKPHVTVPTGVRRLMPIECLRLQGMPDDWLDGCGLSDSAMYRLIGNAVARPVVEWLGRRIVENH